jgi:hypothetical protein
MQQKSTRMLNCMNATRGSHCEKVIMPKIRGEKMAAGRATANWPECIHQAEQILFGQVTEAAGKNQVTKPGPDRSIKAPAADLQHN